MPLLDPIPFPVPHADYSALEWEPLLTLVAGFAASPVGRQAILDLSPPPTKAGSPFSIGFRRSFV